MFEVLNHYLQKIHSSVILKQLSLEKSKYFIVSSHREENINSYSNFIKFVNILNLLAETYNFPVIVTTHPRTRKMIVDHKIQFHKLIQLEKPFSFSDYLCLQINSYAVLSDSGTISEESSILDFPALNIREAHERPEAMEETSVIMVGLNPDRIMQGLTQLKSQMNSDRIFRLVADYNIPNVSEKVVRIIISYCDYIKRVVWSEKLD
jgi:UDP-N-acetylglucosamine 2-epimerase (non-hydrolysing)